MTDASLTAGTRPAEHRHGVSLGEAFRVWLRVAALSFGGPAGQIAVMHRIIVEEKKWVGEIAVSARAQLLHAAAGSGSASAQDLYRLADASLAGRDHRRRAVSWCPASSSIMALSYIYAAFGNVPAIAALFFGSQGCGARDRAARGAAGRQPRAQEPADARAGAALAFIGIFFFARAVSADRDRRRRRSAFLPRAPARRPFRWAATAAVRRTAERRGPARRRTAASMPGRPSAAPCGYRRCGSRCGWCRSLVIAASLGGGNVFTQIGAVLLEDGRRHLRRRLCGARLHGAAGGRDLWLAEARRDARRARHGRDHAGAADHGRAVRRLSSPPTAIPARLPPMLAGTLGGLLATWCTFVPCFLWIGLGAPFIERLRDNKPLSGALAGITAAVVGVILNLAIWFALHTWFREARHVQGVGFSFDIPVLRSVDPWALLLSIAAMIAIFRFKVGMIPTLLACSAAGVLLHLRGRVMSRERALGLVTGLSLLCWRCCLRSAAPRSAKETSSMTHRSWKACAQPGAGIHDLANRAGGPAQWAVVADPTAAGGRAIAQTSTDKTDYRFPLAIYKPHSGKNVEVSVRFKPVAGSVDQAGGIAVRLQTPDDYYVVRANALEDNVRFYRVVKGKREQLAGTNTKVATQHLAHARR